MDLGIGYAEEVRRHMVGCSWGVSKGLKGAGGRFYCSQLRR